MNNEKEEKAEVEECVGIPGDEMRNGKSSEEKLKKKNK